VTGRSQAGLESARKELGNEALVVSSDARSLTDIDALAAQVKVEFDTFDLLFVNAGFSIPTPLDSVTEAILWLVEALNSTRRRHRGNLRTTFGGACDGTHTEPFGPRARKISSRPRGRLGLPASDGFP
jgi:NAD(P)-dependent dehydrogenase (short-subunit alcohol dehydrogenase family)